MALKIQQSAKYSGPDYWKWSVWLEGSPVELRRIQKVVYLLHPTFSPPTRVIENRRSKFRLDSSGWGEFRIRADVYDNHGKKVERLEHELKLTYPPEAQSKQTGAKRASRKSKTREGAPLIVQTPESAAPESVWLAHAPPTVMTDRPNESHPSATAHVTFIHGFANKLSSEKLLRAWLAALADGGGIDLPADGVSASMVYWADVLNAEPLTELGATNSLEEAPEDGVAKISPAWELNLARQEQFFVESQRSKLASVEAKANSQPLSPAGVPGRKGGLPLPSFIKHRALEYLLRDVHHYLFNVEFSPRPGVTYKVRDEIRRRFVTALQGVTARPHIVVAHCMGTVIAYDCLQRVADCSSIDVLMTIGSLLGLNEIQDMLRPEWSRRNGFPVNKVKQWVNVFDALDPVAGFDPKLANDFQRNGQKVVEDIHEPNSGLWRHSIENYLHGPLLRQALQRALKPAPVAPPERPATEESRVDVDTRQHLGAEPVISPATTPTEPAVSPVPPYVSGKDVADPSPLMFFNQLRDALDAFDHQRVVTLCGTFVQRLRFTKSLPPAKESAKFLDQLRRKRHFREMRMVADALLQAGEAAPKVRRMYVQALIDEGDIAAGLAMAEDLAADPNAGAEELAEAQGLIGRAYKQWYVQSESRDSLQRAIAAYWEVFKREPQKHLWHGINVVALLARAEHDHHRFDGLPYYPEVARQILEVVEKKEQQGIAEVWDRVTAMEANVALRRTGDAVRWARDYVHSEGTDAFELASTVRQLKEVWQLDTQREPGSLLLPLLEAELLKRKGGEVSLPPDSKASDYAAQLDREGKLEKVFGADSYKTYQWYMIGFERFRSVARLETLTGQGMGTGFLIRGNVLDAQFGDELLLLTNAHVLSDDLSIAAALTAAQVNVNFESLTQSPSRRYGVQKILHTSRPGELDFTLSRLEIPISHTDGLPLSPVHPNPQSKQRLYAIGHPLGGGLSISLHDNLLIDFKSPFLHYRTPTDPGSSGSPIFDDQWNLIALHHAGSKQMPRLTGEGTHEANEGIWLRAIQEHLRGSSSISVPLQIRSETTAPAGHIRDSSNVLQTRSFRSERGATMNHSNKKTLLEEYMKRIAPPGGLETMTRPPSPAMTAVNESFAAPRRDEPTFEAGQTGVEKLARGDAPTEHEMASVEAIILPRERPVVFIENNTYATPDSPWEHFATNSAIKTRIERAIPSIGRVELPSNLSIPFGGTAFIVGPDMLMTNRHVAELFASGLGMRSVMFRSGQSAGWDSRRERTSPRDGGTMLDVKKILMIHPYWDMALLQVVGLNDGHRPLRLSVIRPEELADRDVAVIGYPAKDWRNDSELQDRIFGRVFNVKRLQPGKIKSRASIRSFEHEVSAMTHDSSTLGGNSGSAIVDAQTGDVVGLHFAGQYLLANYAVPTYELARDQRIADLGVNFTDSVSPDARLTDLWRRIEPQQEIRPSPASTLKPDSRPTSSATTTASVRLDVGNVSYSIPVQVSVTSTSPSGRESSSGLPATGTAEILEGLKMPIVFPCLDNRAGYDPGFLELDNDMVVSLPKLTAAGEKVAARIDGGSPELKYHKFSIFLHKKRRMALFTASNVDWRDELRRINGKKPTRKELTGLTDGSSEKWFTDERIPENQQLPDEFYTKDGGNFDKGHVVRRDDVCWGTSFKDIQKANGDTYHTTNCSPQVSGFNQAAQGQDNWGDLENLVQSETGAERVIVFAGPVLDKNDLRFEGVDKRGEVLIQIPSKFWKIVVAKGEQGPQAFGFVLEQDLSQVPLEFAVPAPWRKFMKRIDEIEPLLFGLASLDSLKPFDQFDSHRGRRVSSRMRR